MTSPSRPYRGVSADERRSQRHRQLLDGCLDVVLAEGTMQVTVDKVCAAAGLTKRYFYESFTDLDALLLATASSLFDRLFAAMAHAAAAAESPAAARRDIVTAVVSALDADPRGARLYVECPGHPVLRARRDEAVTAFAAFVLTLIVGDAAATPQQRFQTRLLVAGATDLITGHLDGSIPATTADVVRAVTDLADAI